LDGEVVEPARRAIFAATHVDEEVLVEGGSLVEKCPELGAGAVFDGCLF